MATRRSLSITRVSIGEGFEYWRNGKRLRKRSDISRIEAITIPPAWTNVEISASATAKVQARGRDAAGRAQAIYHPGFRRHQERLKFARAERFGQALPRLRAQVAKDLRRRKLSRRKVAACVVFLMDKQLFRVGNQQYVEANGSFGITTLHKKHLTIGKDRVRFDFRGKSGTSQRITIHDQRTARLLAELMELSGPSVFQFWEEDDEVPRPITSNDVNAYIRHCLGKEFSAKDFRTWGGTVVAVQTLLEMEATDFMTKGQRAAAVRHMVAEVASKLGNTEAIARGSYIDPRVLEFAEHPRHLERLRAKKIPLRPYRTPSEQKTLVLLKRS